MSACRAADAGFPCLNKGSLQKLTRTASSPCTPRASCVRKGIVLCKLFLQQLLLALENIIASQGGDFRCADRVCSCSEPGRTALLSCDRFAALSKKTLKPRGTLSGRCDEAMYAVYTRVSNLQ